MPRHIENRICQDGTGSAERSEGQIQHNMVDMAKAKAFDRFR
jgi:hypothetical protein